MWHHHPHLFQFIFNIYFIGVGKVHFTETKTGGYRLGNYTEHYRSEIEYICLKQTLIGGKGSSLVWLFFCI